MAAIPEFASFKACCRLGAGVTFALFWMLLVAPSLVFWLFGIGGGESATFLARRAAMLVLGLSATLWLGRHAPPSPARQAIALGTATTLLSLAVLGSVELARGAAGPGIGVAILVEALLGAAFLRVWWSHRLVPS